MSASCVYLLPGIGSSHHMFDAVAPLLPDYELIGWDLPGYGTVLEQPDYDFGELAQSVIHDMDNRGIEQAHLLGHSIGGMVALETAITHHGRVKSLILSGTTPAFGGRDDSFKTAFLSARLKPLDDGMSMAQLAEKSVPELTAAPLPPALHELAIKLMRNIPQSAYRAALQCLVTFNRRDNLADLLVPCLLLAGELDQNAPLKTMQKMAQKIPHAQIVEFANTGHYAPLETPEKFAAAIDKFIKEVE